MSMKKIFLVISILCLTLSAFSQGNESSSQPLPQGYKGIVLGMDLDTTKDALIQNPEFGYNGDRDVSLIPGDNKVLIETDATKALGSIFLTQCWFQFYEGKLYIITINMNTEKMDYYTMFTTLCNKYGQPKTLDPSKASWENDDVIMILEKPLSLKYIDKQTYTNLLNYANVQASAEELTRQMFLEEF